MTAVFFVLWLLTLLALAIAVGGWSDEHDRTERLEAELARRSDPARQLALIRELGETGRREVRRLAGEVHEALGATWGGGR
jgi:hypothetical protein